MGVQSRADLCSPSRAGAVALPLRQRLPLRLRVRLLVAGQHGHGALLAAHVAQVLQRRLLHLRRPLPAERVPAEPLALRQVGQLRRPLPPVADQVPAPAGPDPPAPGTATRPRSPAASRTATCRMRRERGLGSFTSKNYCRYLCFARTTVSTQRHNCGWRLTFAKTRNLCGPRFHGDRRPRPVNRSIRPAR